MKKLQTIIAGISILASVKGFAVVLPNFAVDSHEGPRLVTVITGQPYYKSTGINSSSPETMFPFSGFAGNGVLDKPAMFSNWRTILIDNFYNKIPLKQQANFVIGLSRLADKYPACATAEKKWICGVGQTWEAQNLFERLFSLDNAKVSYNFGTGFWAVHSNPAEEILYSVLEKAVISIGGVKDSYQLYEQPTTKFMLGTGNSDEINNYLNLLGSLTYK